MADQLLATFYVQSPEVPYIDMTVMARVQYSSGTYWYENTGSLRCTVTNAHYADENGQRRRYKIDVFRVETSDWYNDRTVYYYPLSRAGTHRWRLQVLVSNNVMLERMLYITIQPNLHVYIEDGSNRIDLIHTEETVVSQNPLVKTLTVKKNESSESIAARTIALVQPNAYKETIFVQTNVPIDLVSNDLTEENTSDDYYNNKWVQLKDTITITRKIKNTDYKWGGYY
ncbi:MAG: hypothetical protein FWE95_02305 [Planctomycetaceae bacterium]|nr:hypothetical protein [Planctomycetaceae bacterium]